jgi:signal transduction histidine kinase
MAGQQRPQAGPHHPVATVDDGELTWWDRAWAASDRWTPYVLLAVSTVMALLSPERAPGAWIGTLALVAIAFGWILVGHTLAPARLHDRRLHQAVYLAGFLGLASALMSRDMIFFVFTVAGFLHAASLRPLPLVFVGTASTSFLILYFTWGGVPATAGERVAFAAVLMIQTFLIGFGVTGGQKLAELSEQRRGTVADLEATLAENAALQAQLVQRAREAGVSEERQRMAREIHDTLAQGLTGVITQLEAAGQVEHDPVARRRHLDDAASLARHSLAEARRSVQALAPGALEQGRLPDALDQHVREWSARHGVTADADVAGASVALPADVEVALLRVAQEAMSNVAKHADATRVGVTLSLLDDRVVLDVRDDGRGFYPAAVPDHGRDGSSFGLIAMRQRVVAHGGELAVESSPGTGTAISASIPIADQEVARG